MLTTLEALSTCIGHTPVQQLRSNAVNLYIKLEYYNFSGSIKDRPAFNILYKGIVAGDITPSSLIVESSSGNFAIALASICSRLGLRFIAVIDPNINKDYEQLLELMCYDIIKVTEVDKTGGYLLNRIAAVKKIVSENPDAYWPNQYNNPNNYLSYYEGLGNEIADQLDRLDYLFVGVSTGGTIIGLSMKLKERFPHIRVIGVDIEGSVIFGGKPQRRYISGIGASFSSPLLDNARIDEVIHVSQSDVIKGCKLLLKEQTIFAGASTGAVYSAIKNYFQQNHKGDYIPSALFLCADRGAAYQDNVYSKKWAEWLESMLLQKENV